MSDEKPTGETYPVHFFAFRNAPVRVLVIDGQTWWVAVDVCGALDLTNSRKALSHLDEDERLLIPFSRLPDAGTEPPDALDRGRTLAVINEPGLYSLVLRSRKPEARAFKRWITHEVLPSIRRTGSYSTDHHRPPAVSPEETRALLREVSRITSEATVAAVREMNVELRSSIREGFTEVADVLRECLDGAPHPCRIPAQRGRSPRGGTDAGERKTLPAPDQEPLWHADIPEDALTFGALAERLSREFEAPPLTRDRLFAIARDARLIVPLTPPFGGHTLVERRHEALFRVRRVNGSGRGWSCSHHFQPMVLPEGIAVMRQLALQYVEEQGVRRTSLTDRSR
ncbi:BRO-N domain-containing protein [Streptomyces alkaliphilus]|uniref:BRO-N domain-containing protein n=1 Tax=Streptomyces alkaliphilus TaxID=1472722 RepID=UPI00117D66B4|nr:Bro-N domain-containing protein [Streptomyces alkaliphilus]MQS06017.1 hypothetical protein [Streptomyces alkaliphilus]